MSIDGKVQKGRLKFEEEHGYPIHAVSLVDHQTGIVLTQGHVEKQTSKARARAQENKSKRSKKKRNRRASLR